ncbi:hypothetical protein chiPu_0013049 [Chiloscyllium punctatum]|uniref:Uncharacterized protein n=1 Tax=Chiloscyllium punctatum TaxID=137246 RepID=A0A401SW03_CHIPU|nr:hypothetical protein [Chiloscyllium punctatum]
MKRKSFGKDFRMLEVPLKTSSYLAPNLHPCSLPRHPRGAGWPPCRHNRKLLRMRIAAGGWNLSWRRRGVCF